MADSGPQIDGFDGSVQAAIAALEDDEAPECHRSLPVNPGHAFREAEADNEAPASIESLYLTMEEQHLQVLERLSYQDKILEQLEKTLAKPLLRAPAEKKLAPLEVGPAVSHKSSMSSRLSLKPRRAFGRAKATFTPQFFTTYTQADLSLKQGAFNMHAVRSRRRFASMKTEQIQEPQEPPLVARILGHPAFDAFFALTVIANTVYIGIDVQSSIEYPEGDQVAFHVGNYVFTFLFVVELVIRVAAQGMNFFCSEDWMWALLDTFIVITSLWDIVMDAIYFWPTTGSTNSISFNEMSSFKAVRLMRIFRFVMALRMLITSIMHTLKSLFWAMVLLVLIIYAFAVLLAQVVNDHMVDPGESNPLGIDDEAAAVKYFGSVQNTMLTLFMSNSGGVNWENVLGPLKTISLAWVFVYLFFIAFTYFAVLNVVTGVFCQSAIDSAQNDHAAIVQSILENKEAHLAKIKTLFSKFGGTGSGAEETDFITFPMFEEKINTPEVRDYFESLRLDIWDAWTFFKMVDDDGGGTIPMDEFLMGCLRLRGQARAVDVGRIIHDQQWMIKNFGKFQTHVEVELRELKDELARLMEGQASFQTPRSSRGSNYSHASNASERGASSNQSAFHESKRSKNSKDGAAGVISYSLPMDD